MEYKIFTIHVISIKIIQSMFSTYKNLWQGDYRSKLYFLFIFPSMLLTIILTFLLDLCGVFKLLKSKVRTVE